MAFFAVNGLFAVIAVNQHSRVRLTGYWRVRLTGYWREQGKPWNYGCECRVAQIIARETDAPIPEVNSAGYVTKCAP